MHLLLVWLVSAVALLVTSRIIPGFRVADFGTALLAAVALGLANAVLWPVLILLTLPVNVLTLGLFTFVVNAALLMLCAALVKGFEIDGWITAILAAVVLALANALLRWLVPGV